MKMFDPSIHTRLIKRNCHLDEFIMLDIEASSLGFGSFPIEVGYASSNGHQNSYLISPISEWLKSGDWDEYAQTNIHKLSKEELIAQGKEVSEVAKELNSALLGKLVFCNDLAYDSVWITSLFEAANVGVGFYLADIDNFYQYIGRSNEALYKEVLAGITSQVEHRALEDSLKFVNAFNQSKFIF